MAAAGETENFDMAEATTSSIDDSCPFLCGVCGCTYKSKRTLLKHERKHTNAAPYRCCGRMFWDRAQVTRHRCNHHGEVKRHACPTCDLKFGTRHDMNKHIKQVHEEKIYVCSVCTKAFADLSKYNDHIAGHNGERKHMCNCGKSYVYASGLYRHKRSCGK